MISNSIKIVLVIFVSSNFLSCNGQGKSGQKQKETKAIAIGEVVSELFIYSQLLV